MILSKNKLNDETVSSAIQNTSTPTQFDAPFNQKVELACVAACGMIAPAWPLDRAIAVNPHWSRIGLPIRQVAARMALLGDIQVFPSRESQFRAWIEGKISRLDLQQAIKQLGLEKRAEVIDSNLEKSRVEASLEVYIRALETPLLSAQLPLLIDVLDNDETRNRRMPWRQAITHQVSQTCASYFDEHQADWRPNTTGGLYSFWRETLQHDQGIGVLMGLPNLSHALETLPVSRTEAERWVIHRLGLPESVWAEYLESVLLTVNGWASWCAYLGWQAKLDGAEDEHLRDLLAIRLAWGAILLEVKDDSSAQMAFHALQSAWTEAPSLIAQLEEQLAIDEVWQLAAEISYQNDLKRRLAYPAVDLTSDAKHSLTIANATVPDAQAAFCIDVRSEPIRRALEAVSPSLQTIGFAGFFGLPVAYTPLATDARRPQLPGLLAPSIEINDQIMMPDLSHNPHHGQVKKTHIDQSSASETRTNRFALTQRAGETSRLPSTAFSFVETAGVGYLTKLWQWIKPGKSARVNDDYAGLSNEIRAVCRPMLSGLDVQAKVELAAKVLHAMGLDRQVSPLVVLVGHGSQSNNNAQAAALDCGACCGQTGEVNARSLALMMNEPDVRDGLLSHSIQIPSTTVFVAALHNTTTDELEGFDLDLLEPIERDHWDAFVSIWSQASDQVRRERAPSLGLDPRAGYQQLLTQLQIRANDGAQTRPEWGLAGNAAFIIAPRKRTKGVVLNGRSFLHDYDSNQDQDASLLELLMTAPMLVTHWINWQYHASTCDPLHMGSGNKLLHNVVGGHIGVFEGNGGDLRIGLSQQSLHNGKRWIHDALRLTVIIDAPREKIALIISKHQVLQNLLDNGWIHLWRFADVEDSPKLPTVNSKTAKAGNDSSHQQFERYHKTEWISLNG